MAHFRLAAEMRILASQIGEILRCKTCGKRTTIANTAGYRQSFAGESVALDTHCSCEGGPAHALRKSYDERREYYTGMDVNDVLPDRANDYNSRDVMPPPADCCADENDEEEPQ